VADAGTKRTAAPARSAGAAGSLLVAGAIEDIVCGALCLGRRIDQKSGFIAKLLEPACAIRGLITNDRVRDSGFGAKIGCSEFRR